MADLDDVKRRLDAEVDRLAPLLLDVSHDIHATPEENFAETHAHALLTGVLEDAGLDVVRHAHGMPTAFSARVGSTGPNIAVLLEYDALPGIGHACGHNIIAAAGLGAGLAAASIAEELGGSVTILGTPAEEGGGGKVFMARDGAFEAVDAALMIHPADHDLITMETIAIQQLEVEFRGLSAHAAAHPWDGINALDAAVLGYVNVAALRQHIRPEERVHGVFISAGEKPNIVPDHTEMLWYVRARDLESLERLKPRVLAALTAGATASGCEITHRWVDPAFADLVRNERLEQLFSANAARLGRSMQEPDATRKVVGSTDMGNVSHLVPGIHPMLSVAPSGVGIHTPAFAEHACGPDGDRAVLDGARAMAATIADLWLDPTALAECRAEFARRMV